MASHTIMFVSLTSAEFEQHRHSIEPRLKALNGNFAQAAFGIWVFKTKECYPTIHYFRNFFERKDIPYVLMPLETPLECALTQDAHAALTAIGVEVYNVGIDG